MIRQLIASNLQIVRETILGVINHDATTFASTIAYSLLFSLFPFLIMIVLAGTAVLGEARALEFENDLLELLPDYVARTIKPEVEAVLSTRATGGILTLGALAILISVSNFVETVRYALNRAYRLEESRGVIYRRATGMLFALVVTFTLIAVAALGLVVPFVMEHIRKFTPEIADNFDLIEIGRLLTVLALTTLLLIAMNSFLPSERLRIRAVLPGVILTLLLLWVFSRLFVVYLNNFSHLGATYGSLAGVIVLMLFFQFSALALIVGAEFNRAIADHSATPDMRADVEG